MQNFLISEAPELEPARYPLSQPLSPASNDAPQSPAGQTHRDSMESLTDVYTQADPAPSLQPNDVTSQATADLAAWQAVHSAVKAVTVKKDAGEDDINKALAGLQSMVGSVSEADDARGSSESNNRYARACDVVIKPGGSATIMRGASEANTAEARQATTASDNSANVAGRPPSSAGITQDGQQGSQLPNFAPVNFSAQKLPTATELRQGLVELQSLLVDLKDQRRAREESTSQGDSPPASDLQLHVLETIRAELDQERTERCNLEQELMYSEKSSMHCASLVDELESQLEVERSHHASELAEAAAYEAQAVARANDDLSSECRELHAKLAATSRQEARSSAADLQDRCRALSSEASDLAQALQAAKSVARHEAAAVGQLRAEQAAAVAELRAERDQLLLQEEAASAAQAAFESGLSRGPAGARFDAAGAARREHQLRSSLAASEHQLQLLRSAQQKESSLMEQQADSLERELEHGKLVAQQHWKRSVDLEADVERLTEENKRLHELLIAELSRNPLLEPSGGKSKDAALSSFAERRARFEEQAIERQGKDRYLGPPNDISPRGPPPSRIPNKRHRNGTIFEEDEQEEGSGDAAAGGATVRRREESVSVETLPPRPQEEKATIEEEEPKGNAQPALPDEQANSEGRQASWTAPTGPLGMARALASGGYAEPSVSQPSSSIPKAPQLSMAGGSGMPGTQPVYRISKSPVRMAQKSVLPQSSAVQAWSQRAS